MLIGHHKIFDQLKRDMEQGNLHHAQLFIGPEHVGKAKAALELAVLMQGGGENPILRKHIMEGVHADTFLYLDEGELLKIETVRELLKRVQQSHQSPYLVIVLENLGRMRPESMNALLKTLEEPPDGTVFFLTAHREEDVLPTIRSRVHVRDFQTVSDELLKEACDGHVQTEQLVSFAMGRPGKLRRLLDEPDYFEAHQKMNDELTLFFENPDTHGAFQLARAHEKDPFLQEWLDILLHRARTFALSAQCPPVLAEVDMTDIMDKLEQAKADLRQNINKKLLLENLLLPFVP